MFEMLGKAYFACLIVLKRNQMEVKLKDCADMSAQDRLFHGTGIYALAAIVGDNTLEEGTYWGKPGEPHGPRTTESFDVAASFISYNMDGGEGGVIVLNREALARDFQLVNYRDHCYDGEPMSDEKEVAIIAPSVADLDKYIVSIVCDPAVIRLAHNRTNMDEAMQDCGWAFANEGDAGEDEAKVALQSLLNHPKLNAWVPESGYPLQSNWDISLEMTSHFKMRP